MKDGTQIIYFPPHVEYGDETHLDTEFGFVFGRNPLSLVIPCRYWSKSFPRELRTKANSEMTPLHRLMEKDTKHQQIIWKEIRRIRGS